MDDPFLLPVLYKGLEQQFEAALERRGFVHVLLINVYGTPVTFERDEEGCWRALVPPEAAGKMPLALLQAIGEAIDDVLK